MKRVITLLLCLTMVIGIFVGCGEEKSSGAFSVGYGKADITPEDSVPIGGMGDDLERFSTTILDPLSATCVACRDSEGNTVLMFGIDNLTTYGALIVDIRASISEELGIPFDNIMFSASHTHSAPMCRYTDRPVVAKYNEKVKNNCMQAARDAVADLAPAKMYFTHTRPENLNFMRHWVLDDGSYRGWRIYDYNGSIIGTPHKPDNLLQLVKFEREGDKKPVVMINWQAHYAGATKMDYNGISADYPAVLRNELEKQLDCLASFHLSGSGNLVSNPRTPEVGPNLSENHIDHGQLLAAEAVKAAENFQEAEVGKIQVLAEDWIPEGNRATQILYTIGFGDFAIVWAPFEIYDNNSVAVREASKYKYTFYASCANAADGNMYLPDLEGFRYPTYEALGQTDPPNYNYTKFPKGSAESVQNQLISMLDKMYAASGMEVKEKAEGYITPEFVPVSDGAEYTNPTPGDTTAYTEGNGDNGLYCLVLLKNNKMTKMLADSKKTAEAVLSKTSMKLLFDERNVIVGIAE